MIEFAGILCVNYCGFGGVHMYGLWHNNYILILKMSVVVPSNRIFVKGQIQNRTLQPQVQLGAGSIAKGDKYITANVFLSVIFIIE